MRTEKRAAESASSLANVTPWTRDQLLVALRLYLTEPFGRLHKSNPRVVEFAKSMGRTPSSLGMKACNFASLDPTFVKTGRRGLQGVSKADRALWDEYASRGIATVDEMERLVEPVLAKDEVETAPVGPSEREATVRLRRHQRFFRSSVLAAYEGRCAVTGLALPELLIASHIVPWSRDEERRADPSNGLLLEPLLDRAFDRGLVTFDEDEQLVCSRQLQRRGAAAERLVSLAGLPLRRPRRQPPSAEALSWHRERWFLDSPRCENRPRG